MFRLSLAMLAAAWLLQELDAHALLAVPALAWASGALVTWCALGGRAALVVLAAGWTMCRAGWLIETRLPEFPGKRDALVRGVVCEFPRADPEALRFVIDTEPDRDFARMPGRLHLTWYDRPPQVQPGSRWQLRVRLKPPHGLSNPGGFDFEQWLYLRGIGASGYVRASRLNRPLPGGSANCPVGAARGFLARRIEAALGARPGAGYVLGLAVGATHRLTEADWQLLRRTGTTHLLAISGMHIAMIAAPFLLAGPLLGRAWPRFAGRPRAGLAPALAAATAYAALSGFAVSTVRALVMLMVASALALRRRRIEGHDMLAAAAMAVLAIHPAAVVSVSFWLSFLAVAWLYLAARTRCRPVQTSGPQATVRGTGWWRRAAAAGIGLTRVQLVLGLGLAPITLAWFGQVSLIAPVSNLIAVPLFSLVIMPLTLLGTALIVPAPAAGAFLLRLAADSVEQLLTLLRIAAGTPFSVWEPPTADAAALAAAAFGAAILCWWRPVPLRPLALGLLVPVASGVTAHTALLRVTVMDVGQGLAVLVTTQRHAMLYDAGPAYRLRDAGESVIVPVLHRAGIRRLDLLLISHQDQDHAGGAGSVLAAYPRARLIAPPDSGVAAGAHQPCETGLSWEWDGVRFLALSPGRGSHPRSDNDGSCVLRIETRQASLLLPGDIERHREAELARRGVLLPTDLVLAPHHGSRSSSSPGLVSATHPRFVVFSVGYLNRWGFPSASVLRRWQDIGACALETDADGALVFATDAGGRLQLVRRERVDGAHLWTNGARGRAACPDSNPG